MFLMLPMCLVMFPETQVLYTEKLRWLSSPCFTCQTVVRILNHLQLLLHIRCSSRQTTSRTPFEYWALQGANGVSA